MSKNGFSYYKAETDRFQDIKIKRLKKKYGCDGYAVYQYALNEIYRVDGSYIRWTEDQLFDCADYWSLNEARVKEIICYCAEICLFDPVIWKTQCILTSRAIQSRYLDICKVSKKKSYIPLGILLVEPEQQIKEVSTMPLFDADAVSENEQNAPTLPISPQEETQIIPETLRKKATKKRKTKKSKAKRNPPLLPRCLPDNSRRRKQNLCFLLPHWVILPTVTSLLPSGSNHLRRKRRRARKSHAMQKG